MENFCARGYKYESDAFFEKKCTDYFVWIIEQYKREDAGVHRRTKRRNWYLWFLVAAGVAGLVALWLMIGRDMQGNMAQGALVFRR